jgi:hypothetical protein
MKTIDARIERLEQSRPFTRYDPSKPMVIVLRPGDPDPEPVTDGPGPLILICGPGKPNEQP